MSIIDILDSLPGKNNRRLTELGKIKIGGLSKKVLKAQKTGKEWRPPEKYDHFVITTMQRDASGDLIIDTKLMDELIATHGDDDGKLRTLPIRLLSDDIEDVMQSAFVWYRGKSPGARGDGKTVTWFASPQDNLPYDPPVEEPWGPELLNMKLPNGSAVFKVHTNLSCVIASKNSRWGGVYKFRTTSLISLTQLHGSLLHLSSLTGGILMGMPLMLVLRPVKVNPDGKPSTAYVVHVELRGEDLQQLQSQAVEMAKFKLAHISQIQATQKQYRRLLEGPGNEAPEEAEDINAEFSPDEEESTAIVTVAPDARFGTLDDAPEAALPATIKDAPAATPATEASNAPPPSDESPDEPGSDGELDGVDLDHQQDDLPDAEEAKRMQIADICDQSWPNFLKSWASFAKRTEADVSAVAGKIVLRIGRKGKEETISKETRRQWVESGEDGRLDWVSGSIANQLTPSRK
jgi:hypothetical protein